MAILLGAAAAVIVGNILFGVMLVYSAKREIWQPDTSEATPYVDDPPTVILTRCGYCLHYHQAHDWCAVREAELVASHADSR